MPSADHPQGANLLPAAAASAAQVSLAESLIALDGGEVLITTRKIAQKKITSDLVNTTIANANNLSNVKKDLETHPVKASKIAVTTSLAHKTQDLVIYFSTANSQDQDLLEEAQLFFTILIKTMGKDPDSNSVMTLYLSLTFFLEGRAQDITYLGQMLVRDGYTIQWTEYYISDKERELEYDPFSVQVLRGIHCMLSICIGKTINMAGETDNFPRFVASRVQSIVNILSCNDLVGIGLVEIGKKLALTLNTYTCIRKYIFEFIYNLAKSGENTNNQSQKSLAHIVTYWNGAFMTSQTLIMKHIVNNNLYQALDKGMLEELSKLISYLQAAQTRCLGGWTFARLGLLDSELKPVPSTEIPMISNLAKLLTKRVSNSAGQIGTGVMSTVQTARVSKALKLCENILEEANKEALLVSNSALGGSGKNIPDIMKDPSEFIPVASGGAVSDDVVLPSEDIVTDTVYTGIGEELATHLSGLSDVV